MKKIKVYAVSVKIFRVSETLSTKNERVIVMNEIEKKIKDCLNCAVGQEVLKRYCSIADYAYEETVNDEEYLADLKQIMCILEISDFFGKDDALEVPYYWLKSWSTPWAETDIRMNGNVKGKSQKDYEKKRDFSIKIVDVKKKMGDGNTCFVCLQKIIRACKNLYMIENADLEEECYEDSGHLKVILKEMYKINKQRRVQTLVSEEDFEKALQHMNTRNKKHEDISQEDRKKDVELYRSVFNDFCHFEPRTLHCGCASEFMRLVEKLPAQIDLSESEKFAVRVEQLKADSKEIMVEYLKNANKKFGMNLQIIMQQKNMKEQFLSQITEIPISSIQHLQKDETTAPTKEILFKLSRALLVSEDVLCKGIGKEYGDWKALTDEDSLQSIQEEKGWQRRKTINTIYDKIREVNSFDEPLFFEMLKMIFTDEFPKDIEIAKMVCGSGGEEIMKSTMEERAWNAFRYECLACQEDADTLLEILEKRS